MEQLFKKNIIKTAKLLISAVESDDFEEIAKCMQFLAFSCQVVAGVDSLRKVIDAKEKEMKNGKEKAA